MKLWLKYTVVFGIGLSTFLVIMGLSQSPENKIVGEWKEMEWKYEKVNKSPALDSLKVDYTKSSNYVKRTVGQNLIIHEAETWEFLPNGLLKLSNNENKEKIVIWRLKGRGHILELKYDNDTIEHYNLTELDEKRMILNFDSDMQVRGIAKLTFERQ